MAKNMPVPSTSALKVTKTTGIQSMNLPNADERREKLSDRHARMVLLQVLRHST
jgi:hypothetical protein